MGPALKRACLRLFITYDSQGNLSRRGTRRVIPSKIGFRDIQDTRLYLGIYVDIQAGSREFMSEARIVH
jgi:hypothetical protein